VEGAWGTCFLTGLVGVLGTCLVGVLVGLVALLAGVFFGELSVSVMLGCISLGYSYMWFWVQDINGMGNSRFVCVFMHIYELSMVWVCLWLRSFP
jgi:hypothetical protein